MAAAVETLRVSTLLAVKGLRHFGSTAEGAGTLAVVRDTHERHDRRVLVSVSGREVGHPERGGRGRRREDSRQSKV